MWPAGHRLMITVKLMITKLMVLFPQKGLRSDSENMVGCFRLTQAVIHVFKILYHSYNIYYGMFL